VLQLQQLMEMRVLMAQIPLLILKLLMAEGAGQPA
jgi:hypothetical protein